MTYTIVQDRLWNSREHRGLSGRASANRRHVILAGAAAGEDNSTVIVLAVHEPPHQKIWRRVRQRMAL